ncbi:MAG: hypothetical protein HY263_06885 [Chloroflexi bacterium]|nr:hypothetical protein [Chloroflexota bacterium]
MARPYPAVRPDRASPGWWTRLAGSLLILDGIGAAFYSGILTGSATWTMPLPTIGTVPVIPILLAMLPALSGIGILRAAGWARAMGIVLAAIYLWTDAFALAGGWSLAVAFEAATSLVIVFALVRRWTPGHEMAR